MIQDISETLTDFLFGATITLRLLKETANRLGDLQISKITRSVNLNLSLSELLNSTLGLGFTLESLAWDAHRTSVRESSVEQPPANGGWVRGIYRW